MPGFQRGLARDHGDADRHTLQTLFASLGRDNDLLEFMPQEGITLAEAVACALLRPGAPIAMKPARHPRIQAVRWRPMLAFPLFI